MRFVDLEFYAVSSAFFVTEDGGTLRVRGNYLGESSEDEEPQFQMVKMSFALGFEARTDGLGHGCAHYQDPHMHLIGSLEGIDSDVCQCLMRVTDADGRIWEAKSLFLSDSLLAGLRLSEGPGPTWRAVAFEEAPSRWKEAFEHNLLLEGIRGWFDDRTYRYLILGEDSYDLSFKHALLTFDIAIGEPFVFAYLSPKPLADVRKGEPSEEDPLLIPDFPLFLVRVSEFRGYRNENYDVVPPFVHTIPFAELMFYPQTSGLPVPLVFKQVGTAEQPQPIVQYVPHAPLPSR